MNENETDVIDGQVGTEYDYIGDVNLDNDPTIAFDGQQREWTYERLQKADELKKLHEAQDWSDDGVPLEFFKYTDKETGATVYCAQSWNGYDYCGLKFSINVWRNYKPDTIEEHTWSSLSYPDGSSMDRRVKGCNRKESKQYMEAFIEWDKNEAGH